MNERNFWRILAHDPEVMGHEFVPDPDDVPRGCAVCWKAVEDADFEQWPPPKSLDEIRKGAIDEIAAVIDGIDQ